MQGVTNVGGPLARVSAPPTSSTPSTRPQAARSATGWRYVPEGKRDQRIDLVRGLAIVVMVTNHLAARSYLNSVLQGRIYATAAEAFVLLSGVVLGMISQGRLVNGTLPEASKKLVDRALTLYKTYVVVVGVAAVATLVRPGVAAPLFDALHGSWAGIAVALPTLRLAPHLLDVLELYVV
jgi:hypothetical protein